MIRYKLGRWWYAEGCDDGGCENCVKPREGTLYALAQSLGGWLVTIGERLRTWAVARGIEIAYEARVPEWSCCGRSHLRGPQCPKCGIAAPALRCAKPLTAAGVELASCDKPQGHVPPCAGHTHYRAVEWR